MGASVATRCKGSGRRSCYRLTRARPRVATPAALWWSKQSTSRTHLEVHQHASALLHALLRLILHRVHEHDGRGGRRRKPRAADLPGRRQRSFVPGVRPSMASMASMASKASMAGH